MCGIAGLLNAHSGSSTELVADVQRMTSAIAHRGPDANGAWVDEEAGIAMGHRRLSILDLTPAGAQPMASQDGRFVIIYNGEIYNHLELRRQLDAGGVTFDWRGHSDTETLVACIQTWGLEATLRRSVGMFALALWDRSERALWLARDRMGEKPLYYGWQDSTFLFGSELKALRAHPDFHPAVDRGALALFLRYNYVPEPYSIYRGVHKLPPGTWLKLSRGQREAEPVAYWSLAEVAEAGTATTFSGTAADAVALLERHLGDAVRGQMVADVPLGALLSGGIDSTLITALMQANSSRPVRTFTIGFEERDYNEAAQAKAVAAHLGTDHTELQLRSQDALDLVPQLPFLYDEPFADSSQLPTHLVMKLARQHVAVALSGDAGDELFGGYNRYSLAPRVWKQLGWMPSALRTLLAQGAARLPNGIAGLASGTTQTGDKLRKLARVFEGNSIQNIDDLYVALVSEWPQPEGMVIGGHAPPTLVDDRSHWPRLSDPVARMMVLDGLTYLPGDILTKVDRASMSVSLETRAPFLDRDVVEFAWTLPMSMKLREGKGKWILRELLDRHVPRELIERPKMGFGIPIDQWLRGPLREWAEGLLSEARLRREGYLDPAPIRLAWRKHLRGEASFGSRLWSVLMFQSWLEASTANSGAP